MHLVKVDYRTAVAWLEECDGVGRVAAGVPRERTSHHERDAGGRPTSLQLPIRDDRRLYGVTQYLTRRRHLRSTLIEPLLQSGTLYADSRGNARLPVAGG